MCEFLLEKGARVDITDKKGLKPMDFARRHNKHQIIDILIKYGASPPVNKKPKASNKKPPP